MKSIKEALKAFPPDHKDKLHNPLLPVWWILGWLKRKIMPGSQVHASVYNRENDLPGYRPKNLPKQSDVGVVE